MASPSCRRRRCRKSGCGNRRRGYWRFRPTLAEASLSLQGRQEARAALAEARKRPLSRAGKARAAYLEALMAGTEKRYADAARLLAEAKPALDPARRAIAAYAEYYARSLADPTLALTPPAVVNDPHSAVLKAYTAGFLEDVPAAIAIIKDAEARFPRESSLPAIRALLAQMNNDRAQMREAIDQALALDPDDSTALLARSRYYLEFEGNLKASLADLNRAVEISPASSTIWNNLGLVEDARGNARAAEAALKRSIELDPESAIGYANLAILYLDQARMKEAKRQIDLALAADPAFSLALLARGRYYLQTGEIEKATDDLLASSVANPGYSQAQLMLAAAHYESGARAPAEQALDNADRLDKNDPVISAARTAIAIDDYDSEGAMRYAQEYLRRSRAMGGDYASLEANQSAGSTLNSAFRLQGLDAWGQYYGDAVFDPFSGSAYIDQSVRGAIDPLTSSFLFGDNVVTNTPNGRSFSSFIQGLLFDPHMLAGRSRSANLLRRPFFEGEIGAGTTFNPDREGWEGEITLQGYANEPVPISGYLNLQYSKMPDATRNQDDGAGTVRDIDMNLDVSGLNGYLTSTITPDDRVVAYVSHSKTDFGFDMPFIPGFFGSFYGLDTTFTTAGVGWSHTIDYRNVVNTALLYSSLDLGRSTRTSVPPLYADIRLTSHLENYVAAASHTVEVDDLVWRYGAEVGVQNTKATSASSFMGIPLTFTSVSDQEYFGRSYVDVLHEITPELKGEYALFARASGGGDNGGSWRLEPRAGLAWTPAEGHWLRAGFMRQGMDATTPTLAPIGLLGLQPNDFSVGAEGYADTFALKWDAEWNDRFFTTVDYQHQNLRDFSINDGLLLSTYSFKKAEVDRVAMTANLAIGYGLGLSTTYALAFSEDKDPASPTFGRELTFLPRHSGQIALTYVNEANIKASLAANYIGERYGNASPQVLDDYWTLDAQLTWEPFDKNIVFEASAYNLLGEEFEVAPGFNGWGRVFKGMVKVRF